jgi:GNAT superfamily N-acetyltransferase
MDDRVREGIRLFNEREFFVCHEVLEEVWTPERGPRRLFLQSLIHVAVGFYHHTRGNAAGAIRQLRKALRKLESYLPVCEGIHTARLYQETRQVLEAIEAGANVPAYPQIHLESAMEIASVAPTDTDAALLIAALDRELREIYPGMPVHGIDAAGFAAAGGVFLVVRIGGRPAACGAIRPMGEGMVEVKRMFVAPEFRRRGLARAILAALEEAATGRGCRAIRLETGNGQPEALALYESAGYRRVPCFGEYVNDPRCCCFEKTL